MGDPSRRKKAVLDATVIIYLAKTQGFGVLAESAEWEFVVPDQVIGEVTYPEQAEALAAALRAGCLRRVSSTDPAEIALYAELRQRMGKGEAACLALATFRGWVLVSDDRGKAFLRLARERLPDERILGTREMLEMVRAKGRAIVADGESRHDVDPTS